MAITDLPTTFPDYRIADAEERHLVEAIKHKHAVLGALRLVAEARKARGDDDTEVLLAADGELAILAGYSRALDSRRRALRAGAKR